MGWIIKPIAWIGKKIAKPIVTKVLVKKQDEIVDFINEKINIPKLNEQEEEVVYDHIYTAMLAIVRKFL